LALGLVHGDVGVLEELGAVLARPFPDHDSDARVLFDLGPSEGERRGDHAEKALGHLLGLSRGSQSFGQVEELVAPQATQRVRRASYLLEATRERYEQQVADVVAEVSFTALKLSRSNINTAFHPPRRAVLAFVWESRSSKRTRLASPVSESCSA